jgi:hypothetical protein
MTLFLFLSLWFGQGQVNAVENQGAANPQQQATQSPSPVIESGKTGQARDSGNDNQSGTTHWLDPLVLLNFALFVAVLIQAGIYWKQLREMRRTLGILKRQADASERQAGVMESQLEAMQGQLEMMRKQAAAGEAQMDIAVRAVGVAERSAIAAENNVEIAQRAYVLIGKVSPMHISDVCEVVKFQVMNFGNTPANDVQTASRAEVADSEPEELNKDSVDWTSDV